MESYREMIARIRADDLAYWLQLAVLAILAAAFYCLILFVAPPQGRVLVPIGGAAFVAAYVVPRFTSEAPSGAEPIAVFLVAFSGFLLPLTLNPPIARSAGIAAILGMLTTQGVWAVRRYAPRRRERSPGREALSEGVRTGLFIAVCTSAYAAIVLGIGSLVGSHRWDALRTPAPLILLLGGYFTGGIAAGVVVALLRHLLRWPLTTMLVGILAGSAVYAAVAPVLMLIRPDATLPESAVVACLCGVLAGPPGALSINFDRR